MMLALVTAPIVDPVSLTELKAHLNLDDVNLAGGDNDLLKIYLDAALAMVDGRAGELQRALITQTWDLRLDCFPSGAGSIELPLAPVQSVTSVTYVDSDGDSQTVSSYQVVGIGTHDLSDVAPAFAATWPSTRAELEAVVVRFVAGYGDEPSDVPARIRRAILLRAAGMYAEREPTGEHAPHDSGEIDALLDDYRLKWWS
jgi:uncharacterized phiE125 gp8 family phage protein